MNLASQPTCKSLWGLKFLIDWGFGTGDETMIIMKKRKLQAAMHQKFEVGGSNKQKFYGSDKEIERERDEVVAIL